MRRVRALARTMLRWGHPLPHARHEMKKPEVLVVDDERDTCELLEMALARQGIAVTTCTTATDALEMIASRDFDAVLTDLSMPLVSGLEVCERVLAVRPEVPVVLITG